jgi:hypothetical protein
LLKRTKSLHKDCEEANGRFLLNEQINEQRLCRAEDEKKSLEVDIKELQEKLDRKEFFMQSKEKKWLDVEKVLQYYIEEDDELRDRFRDLKLIIEGETKLTSVVGQNEKLVKAYHKIDLLRNKMLDPFFRLRDKRTNEYMLGKPPAKKPPTVIVTADEVIRVEEALKRGTCYAPKMDEDELWCEFQKERT